MFFYLGGLPATVFACVCFTCLAAIAFFIATVFGDATALAAFMGAFVGEALALPFPALGDSIPSLGMGVAGADMPQ
jgi:hypothetical protein